MKTTLVTGLSFVTQSQACDFNAASRWVNWVTNAQNKSSWSNSEQFLDEKQHPIDNPHPLAQETRFDVNALVLGAPAEWSFALMEIGTPKACPKACSPTLFGMEPLSNCSTRLTSYDVYNDYVSGIVDCLYDETREMSECTFDYSQLKPNGIYITYDYAYNSSHGEEVFYGEGGGTTSSGSTLFVKETIAPDFVAPLELFYDADGNLLTTYTEPIVYKPKSQN